MPQRIEFTPEQTADIVSSYESGETCQNIAKRYAHKFETVRRVLVNAGVYEHGRRFQGRYTPEQKQEMAERYSSGESYKAIGERFKCHPHNVRILLRNQGVTSRGYRTFPLDPELAPIIRRRREDGLPFSEIARELGLPAHRILKWARQMGISDFKGKRGAASHAWRGGRTIHNGYAFVLVDVNDPLAVMTGGNHYAPEHRVVMARSLGRPLASNESVHHINGDRLDNRLENLQLRKGQHGKGVVYTCQDCGSHNVTSVAIAG